MRMLTAILLSLFSLTVAAQPARLDGNTLDGRPFSTILTRPSAWPS